MSIELVQNKNCDWRLTEALWVVRVKGNVAGLRGECVGGWRFKGDHPLRHLVLVDDKIILGKVCHRISGFIGHDDIEEDKTARHVERWNRGFVVGHSSLLRKSFLSKGKRD